MEIRSLTYFAQPGDPIRDNVLKRSAEFTDSARNHFEKTGFPIQTLRFAAPPYPTELQSLEKSAVVDYAAALEEKTASAGFDYLSLGPALPDFLESYLVIPEIIQATDQVFCSGLMTREDGSVDLPAVRACAEVIDSLGPQDPDGFANLFFTASANVPPGAPFFPAAYHGSGKETMAIAVEGADLALEAFSSASSFAQARAALIKKLEHTGKKLQDAAEQLTQPMDLEFGGIDFSLAPFPEEQKSIGAALEALGLPSLGQHGSTAAAAFLADTIDQARFPRTGFSGLMLPVLEDSILALRGAQGSLGVKDLLLYSAVCGTGLDTIPLPGDLNPEQISAVLFDLAALALRLDKPLTARLMPIPGGQIGQRTQFVFPYFANSRILELDAEPLQGLFQGNESLVIKPRHQMK